MFALQPDVLHPWKVAHIRGLCREISAVSFSEPEIRPGPAYQHSTKTGRYFRLFKQIRSQLHPILTILPRNRNTPKRRRIGLTKHPRPSCGRFSVSLSYISNFAAPWPHWMRESRATANSTAALDTRPIQVYHHLVVSGADFRCFLHFWHSSTRQRRLAVRTRSKGSQPRSFNSV